MPRSWFLFAGALAVAPPRGRPNTRSDAAPPLLRTKFATPGDKSSLGRRAFQEPPAFRPARRGALQARARGVACPVRSLHRFRGARIHRAHAPARAPDKLPWRTADAPSRRRNVRRPNFRGGAFIEQRPETAQGAHVSILRRLVASSCVRVMHPPTEKTNSIYYILYMIHST